MISGSDPEDKVHPQEYRIEVYYPPYLVDGRVQPKITGLPITDWTYGGKFTVTVSISQTGPLKFSLLGAVASTHGNSMGVRTIFPEVTLVQPLPPCDIDNFYSSLATEIRARSTLLQTHTSARELLMTYCGTDKTDDTDGLGLVGSNCLHSMAQRRVTRSGSGSVAILLVLASGPLPPTSRSLVFRYYTRSRRTHLLG